MEQKLTKAREESPLVRELRIYGERVEQLQECISSLYARLEPCLPSYDREAQAIKNEDEYIQESVVVEKLKTNNGQLYILITDIKYLLEDLEI